MSSVTGAIANVTASSWVSFLFTFFELFLLVFLYPLAFKAIETRLNKKQTDGGEAEVPETDTSAA